MQQKKVLGRGLDALLDSKPQDSVRRNEIIYKPVEFIKPNSNQPRKIFDEASIEELAASIKEKGVLQPILVRPVGKEFEIVFGERRFRAALKAGLREVPVLIMNMSEGDALETAIVENIHRKDLNPVEEAEAYHYMMEKFNLTQEELSKKIGKSRSAVANVLRLLKLPENIKEKLRSGEITEGHARALLMAKSEAEMQVLLSKILKENLNVRETEKKASSVRKRNSPPSYVKNLEESLQRFYRVKIGIGIRRNKSGSIALYFSSEEELKNLIDLLLR
ncbi:MAG: ParB/RepB/Spo0J family partition protein [Deltaproteobacteria bacterium]|nr:ParB/RepB/Spo0J family partition protein [Deltaproteobacteria bacterium]